MSWHQFLYKDEEERVHGDGVEKWWNGGMVDGGMVDGGMGEWGNGRIIRWWNCRMLDGGMMEWGMGNGGWWMVEW